jgi:hypothetical protein
MGLNEVAALMSPRRLKKGVLPIWMHWVTTAEADEKEAMGVGLRMAKVLVRSSQHKPHPKLNGAQIANIEPIELIA